MSEPGELLPYHELCGHCERGYYADYVDRLAAEHAALVAAVKAMLDNGMEFDDLRAALPKDG